MHPSPFTLIQFFSLTTTRYGMHKRTNVQGLYCNSVFSQLSSQTWKSIHFGAWGSCILKYELLFSINSYWCWKFCPNGHKQVSQRLQSSQTRANINYNPYTCWSHNVHRHDFFLNYRVASEGNAYVHSQVIVAWLNSHSMFSFESITQKPIIQEIYEILSCQKTSTGDNVFVYWDKMCLNYGQNWQDGFLFGMQNAKVIVLLISVQV